MITFTTDEQYQIKGLCADSVFVAAKCAENGVTECPYFAKESAMCEANPNAVLAEVRAEIYKLKFKSDIIERAEKVGEGQLLKNYNKGLMDALEIFNKKVSEHFAIMNTDKTAIETENQPSCLGAVSGSLPMWTEIHIQPLDIDDVENSKVYWIKHPQKKWNVYDKDLVTAMKEFVERWRGNIHGSNKINNR